MHMCPDLEFIASIYLLDFIFTIGGGFEVAAASVALSILVI